MIDDHLLFSAALVIALAQRGLAARTLELGSLAQVLEDTARVRDPGLAVVDLQLGVDSTGQPMSGVDLVAPLARMRWSVLVVSGAGAPADVAAAIAAGAIGCVPKSASFDTLLRAVLSGVKGLPVMTAPEQRTWIAMHRARQQDDAELSAGFERLSTRERQVLELLAGGHRAAAIADHFVVSMTTVRTQIRSVLTKLDVSSQLEAVALVHRRGSA